MAAIFAFLTRGPLGATLIGLISFSWLSTALVLYATPPPQTSTVLGVFSLALVMVMLGATAVLGKPILAVLIAVAAVR